MVDQGTLLAAVVTAVGVIVWGIRQEGKIKALDRSAARIDEALKGKADKELTDERVQTLRHDLEKWERQGNIRIRDLERIVGRAKVFTDVGE